METLSKYRHFLQKSAIFRGNLSIFKKYPNQIYHSIFFKIYHPTIEYFSKKLEIN